MRQLFYVVQKGCIMVYLILLLSFIGFELYLKARAQKELSSSESIVAFGGKIRLHQYHNQGAFLNMLQSRRRFLLLLSCLLTLAIGCLFLIALFRHGNHLLKLGLTLLLGGAFCNTYDRLKKKYVVDYFSFHTSFPALNRIVFNLSDFAILIGSLLSVIGS